VKLDTNIKMWCKRCMASTRGEHCEECTEMPFTACAECGFCTRSGTTREQRADEDPVAVIPDQLAEARAALHLDVPCPRCNVGVSEPCRTESGKYRPQVHAARYTPSGWLLRIPPDRRQPLW
jgi:hypothetical protein